MRVWMGTRKGLVGFTQQGDAWVLDRSHFRGTPVARVEHDPTTGRVWAALDHGHWGQKLHRSDDDGVTWTEVKAPAYPIGLTCSVRGVEKPASVEAIWALHARGDRVWVGTIPGGLFLSADGGQSFELVRALWDHPHRAKWFGGGKDSPGLHSIVVHPHDPARLWVGVSCGGVYESTDTGASWVPRNKGMRADFLPQEHPEVGLDPHRVVQCPAHPEVLWQQNHCGVYRSTDAGESWVEVSQGDVDFGFGVVAHPTDPDRAWVLPAESDDCRMTLGGRLQVYTTSDGGESWTAQRTGLPQANAHDLVYRHALDGDGRVLAFGSTTGNAYVSVDGGDSWACLSNHLPPIYSVFVAP